MDTATHFPQRIREPGLYLGQLKQERYVIKGGGALFLPCYQGDVLTFTDPQGLQPVHIAAFDEKGNSSLARVGCKAEVSGADIAAILQKSGTAGKAMLTKLDRFTISLADAEVAILLNGETDANSQAVVHCNEDALIVLATPGYPGEHAFPIPPTDVILLIQRNTPPETAEKTDLPEALADPINEIRVHNSTAESYQIRKGDYIQIIDVQGRQCSDFQCFSARRLEQGAEVHLDPTVTRSLGGLSYPAPGIYSKLYSTDFEPLVEIVQDSCGRHDSFGLACTSKYYEDAGYPGHINCSDNFNSELAQYAIKPRKGWAAMNFFFNTFFDDSYTFLFDDPWSRPGDYVLLRALQDIVCISSACPCDIDPANGWIPTDIHVRTYSGKNMFKRSIAFRATTDGDPEMTKETGFHSKTSALTRNFTEYNGYWLANDFTNYGAIAEYWACRERVIMTDLSPLRKYEVLGPDAEQLLNTCVTRNIRRLADGQVVYTAMCYESGGMIDDGTVFRLGKNNFRWIGGSDDSGLWLRQQAEKRNLRAWVKNATEQLHNLQVQGPKSRELLEKLIWTRPDQPTLSELSVFRFSIARMLDQDGIAILVSRTGYTGEMGYEIFCDPKDAPKVWDIIWQEGQSYGIAPLGLLALDMLRIEAGLIFAGYEFCDQTDPYEAGIGFTVPLKTKEDDFIGRQALIQRKEHPQRKLVGLELVGKEPAVNGDGVYIGKEEVGTITSAVVSPYLGKNIALCRMKTTSTDIDNQVEVGKIDGKQKRIPARVVRFPHFDPTKERVKGNYQ